MASRAANILQGAHEALAIARGEVDRTAYTVHVPAELDVRAIRAATGLTQAAFAAAFGFPAGTLRDWEQGRTRPDMAARSYLLVIQHDPEAVRETLANLQNHENNSRDAATMLSQQPSAAATEIRKLKRGVA